MALSSVVPPCDNGVVVGHCNICEKPLPKGRRKYCSKECKFSAEAARAGYVRHGGQFTCTICDSPFERPGPGYPPKACSDECRRQLAVQRTTAWQKANPQRTAEHRRKTWAKYYAANREAMIARVVEYNRANPEPKRARDAARYALTRGAPEAERFTLDEIYERDGGRCHLCRKPVGRPAATMDHLVPVALGGSHTRANVALAHRSCNSSKKTAPRGEQLRLIG